MFLFWCFVTFAMCIMWRVVIQRWFKERSVPRGTVYPPMPPVSTILGHQELNWNNFHYTKAVEWAKEYGPVYRLNLNFVDVVVLSDVHSIQTFCKNNDGLYRSGCFMVGRDYNKGLSTQNGECWTANRRYCMSLLHNLGFAKTSMEEHMMDDFHQLEARIGATKGQPISIHTLIIACVTKHILSFFYPNGLSGDDAALCKATSILDKLKSGMMGSAGIQFLPGLIRNLLNHIPFSRNAKLEGVMKELDNFVRDQIENYKPSTSENNGQGFIAGYMKKVEEARQEPFPKFQERFLVGNVKTFLIAGTFSTTYTVQWHLLNFAAKPDIQSRVQREIDEVVGADRRPRWEDRRRMPYTLACCWEIHRWKPAPPLGVPREANEDIVINDFFIPKGTVVLFNMWAAHYDVGLWSEPHRFDPSRFLDKDGLFVHEKLDNVVSFSAGKRSCPGEVFASMKIFLMVTCLLQKYRIVLEQPLQYDLDDPSTRIEKLDHVRMCFLPRYSAED
ncbi:cytochrome P450 2C31-like [Dermacentor silvarum]|uniref:cytochrome P450 2C31-like n=1 Tax=Dermacentor silvarum TaxID=543639 RepID=UPI0021006E8D|nr:cytochrome P450 2C31-like [Dermacentor silvarum]